MEMEIRVDSCCVLLDLCGILTTVTLGYTTPPVKTFGSCLTLIAPEVLHNSDPHPACGSGN